MNISKRLKRVSDFVTRGYRLADIGTDHGYVPIFLIRNGTIQQAIAMDINEGPLQRAKDNIIKYKLEKQIVTRLSDGLEKLSPGEADSILIAGMGGALEVQIMSGGLEVLKSAKELVLSPHSELDLVRHFLSDHNFQIEEEDMFVDEGKYYTVIKARPGSMIYDKEIFYKYGKCLLENRNPVLYEFLLKEKNTYHKILAHLHENQKIIYDKNKVAADKRIDEIKQMLGGIENSLAYYI